MGFRECKGFRLLKVQAMCNQLAICLAERCTGNQLVLGLYKLLKVGPLMVRSWHRIKAQIQLQQFFLKIFSVDFLKDTWLYIACQTVRLDKIPLSCLSPQPQFKSLSAPSSLLFLSHSMLLSLLLPSQHK